MQPPFEFTPSPAWQCTPAPIWQFTPSPLWGEGWGEGCAICQNQLTLLRRHAHYRKRTAFALTQGLEKFQRLGRDGHHIALLALIAPDFLGGQAGLFEWHSAQIKARTTARVVGEFGEGIAQPTCADVVNGEDWVAAQPGAVAFAIGGAIVTIGEAVAAT